MLHRWLFRIAVVGFAAGAVSHAIALAAPQVLEPSPWWRHALFIVVNTVMAVLFIRRPRWLWLAFAPLFVQQLYSHGTQFATIYAAEARIDWASVGVMVFFPVLLLSLLTLRRGTAASLPPPTAG